MIEKLNHVAIAVPDLDAVRAFAVRLHADALTWTKASVAVG